MGGSVSRAPGATGSVLAGALGLILGPLTIFLGFAFGTLAIVMAVSARSTLRREPDLQGRGRAAIGLALGLLSLAVTAAALFWNLRPAS